MNLGEKAAFIAAVIATVVFTFIFFLARSRARKRAESVAVSFTVGEGGVADTGGNRLAPSFLMAEEEVRVIGVAREYPVFTLTLDVAGERFVNRYVDQELYKADLDRLVGPRGIPALDLHIGFQPDGQRAVYTWLSQEWSPLLLGQGDRLAPEAATFVRESLRTRLPTDGSVKIPAARLGRFVASLNEAFGGEIEASVALREERDRLAALWRLAGEGELFVLNGAALAAILSKAGTRSLHRRADDGLAEIDFA